MKSARRYKNMNTDTEGLYKSIFAELQNTKELNIVNELKGEINGQPFQSITATRASIPRALVGALREATVTLIGTPNDFIVEVHTGEWLSNVAMPGLGGLVVAGPIGAALGSGTAAIFALNYQRKLQNKIKQLVKDYSQKELTDDNVESYG